MELESNGKMKQDSTLRNSIDDRTGSPTPASASDKTIGMTSIAQTPKMQRF